MADRAAIQDTMNRYAFGYDEDELDMISETFTADAVMSLRIGRDGDLIGPFEGREAIMGLVKDSLAQQTDQRRHITTNVFYEREDERSATVVSYLLLGSVEDGKLSMLSSGWYRDELVSDDGSWRFKERYLYLDLPY